MHGRPAAIRGMGRRLVAAIVVTMIIAGTMETTPAAEKPFRVLGDIRFSYDFQATMARAGKSGKPVLAYFTRSQSPQQGRRLERDCFSDPDIVRLTRAFLPVVVDCDSSPKLRARFRVSVFPSILVLGPNGENLHRWSGYADVPAIDTHLRLSLDKHAIYLEDGDWTELDGGTDRITSPEHGRVRSFRIPGKSKRIEAITTAGDRVWILRSNVAEELELPDRDGRFALPHRSINARTLDLGSINDLASDGESLYLLSYAWTQGAPIYRYDLETLEPRGEIVTRSRKGEKYAGAYGLAWGDGALWVAERNGEIHKVHPKTGNVLATVSISMTGYKTPLLRNLDFYDGTLVTSTQTLPLVRDERTGSVRIGAGRHQILRLDPRNGRVGPDRLALRHPIQAVTRRGDSWLLVEESRMHYGKNHEPSRIPEEFSLLELTPGMPDEAED